MKSWRDAADPARRGFLKASLVGATASVATSLVDASSAAAAPSRRPGPKGPYDRVRPDPSTASSLAGTVKWFNPDKGFGFAVAEDGGKDVFIHISVLGRSGLAGLAEGQQVSMRVVETPKGREAVSISVPG